MTDRFQAELIEMKADVQTLKECMSLGDSTVHKDLSLVALVPKLSGQESTVTLEEFFSSIEGSARIGKWEDTDQIEVAVFKLAGSARTFYQGCSELHADCLTWQKFEEYSGTGIKTSIRTNTILCDSQRLDKQRMKTLYSLQIDVEL
jgi:hypothetical protein